MRALLACLALILSFPAAAFADERLECARAVQSKLVTTGQVTSADLRDVVAYMRNLPTPAANPKEAELRELAKGLEDIDRSKLANVAALKLVAGDIVFARMPGQPAGSVGVVESFDAATFTATVALYSESATGPGSTKTIPMPLSTDSPVTASSPIRPGILVLRPRTGENAPSVCRAATKPTAVKPAAKPTPLPKAVLFAHALLRRQRAQFAYCYEKAGVRKPGSTDKIVLDFTVARDETEKRNIARDVTIKESTLPKNEEAESCVLERVRKMNFSVRKDGQGVKVTYPLEFK